MQIRFCYEIALPITHSTSQWTVTFPKSWEIWSELSFVSCRAFSNQLTGHKRVGFSMFTIFHTHLTILLKTSNDLYRWRLWDRSRTRQCVGLGRWSVILCQHMMVTIQLWMSRDIHQTEHLIHQPLTVTTTQRFGSRETCPENIRKNLERIQETWLKLINLRSHRFHQQHQQCEPTHSPSGDDRLAPVRVWRRGNKQRCH